MTDVEMRLRTTLHAVSEATGGATSEWVGVYVQEPPVQRGRRPLVLLAAAAAVVAVVAGAATLAPADRRQVAPAASPAVPPPGASVVPPTPEGGRVIAEGTIGSERWVLFGADRLDGFEAAPPGDQGPCFVLAVADREHNPRGCGFDGGTPGDSASFSQLGPAVENGGQVLVFGVLDAEVERVLVGFDSGKEPSAIVPVVDPAHPTGARYLVLVTDRTDRVANVRMIGPAGRVIDSHAVQLDGPVGG